MPNKNKFTNKPKYMKIRLTKRYTLDLIRFGTVLMKAIIYFSMLSLTFLSAYLSIVCDFPKEQFLIFMSVISIYVMYNLYKH